MAEKDLAKLLGGMSPELSGTEYHIGTFDESQMMALAGHLDSIICIFREKEGLTVIFEEGAKEDLVPLSAKKAEGPFALITLNIESDLLAVGFLARIAAALAEESIPSNAVSAYYHDHLLVPYGMRERAMAVLAGLQAGN